MTFEMPLADWKAANHKKNLHISQVRVMQIEFHKLGVGIIDVSRSTFDIIIYPRVSYLSILTAHVGEFIHHNDRRSHFL